MSIPVGYLCFVSLSSITVITMAQLDPCPLECHLTQNYKNSIGHILGSTTIHTLVLLYNLFYNICKSVKCKSITRAQT